VVCCSLKVRDSACELEDQHAHSERVGTPVRDENISTPVENGKTIDNFTVIDLTDSCGGFEVGTVTNDDESSCVTSKNSDLISDSGSDAMDTSTADSEPGQAAELSKVEFHIASETVPCLQPVNSSDLGNETVPCLQPVSLPEPGNESAEHARPMSTPEPIVAAQVECGTATDEEQDCQAQQLQSSNSNSSENEAVGQTIKTAHVTTPVNKNKEQRKSLDKVTISSLN